MRSNLDYHYDALDISPLSMYEREIWFGENVLCSKCKRHYFIASDQDWGYCHFNGCGGIVSRWDKDLLKRQIQGYRY